MLKALVVQAERLDSDDPKERARAAREIFEYDSKTATSHENQKLVNRLHDLIFSVENDRHDERAINSQVDHYLTSQERF